MHQIKLNFLDEDARKDSRILSFLLCGHLEMSHISNYDLQHNASNITINFGSERDVLIFNLTNLPQPLNRKLFKD